MRRRILLGNFIFSLIFIVHVILIGYQALYPEIPDIIVYNKDLSDIDFPVVFKICLFEHENKSGRFEKVGYDSLSSFFHGQSKYNQTNVGWAGHTENGSTLGSVEGLSWNKKLLLVS